MNTDVLLTTGEVASELNLTHQKLVYLLTRGQIPEPLRSVSGRRLWSAEEVEEVRELLEQRERQDQLKKQPKESDE